VAAARFIVVLSIDKRLIIPAFCHMGTGKGGASAGEFCRTLEGRCRDCAAEQATEWIIPRQMGGSIADRTLDCGGPANLPAHEKVALIAG
jgi:hypothetical protein